MDIVARAEALAALLTDDGDVRAYHDPAMAVNNRPCLLVAPPTLEWGEGSWTAPQTQWRIVALSGQPVGSLEALVELNDLVEAADDVLKIERATPARYQLNDKSPLIAAYLCTHTEIED